jgi:hypothetical protein
MELEEIIAEIKELNPEERIHLISEVVSKESGISIVLGNNQLKGEVVYQINVFSGDRATQLLRDIADRLSKGSLCFLVAFLAGIGFTYAIDIDDDDDYHPQRPYSYHRTEWQPHCGSGKSIGGIQRFNG